MTYRTIQLTAILIVAVILIVAACAAYVDNTNWHKFMLDHDCRVIGHRAGQMDTAGHMTFDQTGYRCNDGLEYWK